MTPEAFNTTWLPLADRLHSVALKLTGNQADAEDALQDLYVKLWRTRDSLDAIAIPAAYATTLLKNICLDMQKRQQIRATLPLEAHESEARVNEAAGESARMEHANVLSRALDAIGQLPHSQGSIVRLRILEEKSFEEIAAELGHSPLYIRVQLSLARKNLKKKLEKLI